VAVASIQSSGLPAGGRCLISPHKLIDFGLHGRTSNQKTYASCAALVPGTILIQQRLPRMRYVPIIIMLLCGTAAAAPSFEEEPIKVEMEARETAQDDARNERGLLYDDIEHDAKTDGFASDIQEDCRNNMVRYRRSDGRVITRKVHRCD
jgi:hypothetical protein